jgi:hypothetical protein
MVECPLARHLPGKDHCQERLTASRIAEMPNTIRHQGAPSGGGHDGQFIHEPFYQPPRIESERSEIGITDCYKPCFGAEVEISTCRSVEVDGGRMIAMASTTGDRVQWSTGLKCAQIDQKPKRSFIFVHQFGSLKFVRTCLCKVA